MSKLENCDEQVKILEIKEIYKWFRKWLENVETCRESIKKAIEIVEAKKNDAEKEINWKPELIEDLINTLDELEKEELMHCQSKACLIQIIASLEKLHWIIGNDNLIDTSK